MARKIFTILAIFIAFYMAGHYWIRWRNTVTDDVTKVSKLVDCEPNQVRALSIESKPDRLEFGRVDVPAAGTPEPIQLLNAEWKITAPLKGEADAAMMSRLASVLCETFDPIPVREKDWVAGSGDVKGLSFTVADGAGKGSHIFEFGSQTTDQMVFLKYTAPSGSARFVKLPNKLLQIVSLKPAQYLNMRVMRMQTDNISRLDVLTKGKEIFSLERESEGWKVLAKGKNLGAGSPEADKYVNRVATLRAIKVESEALNPANCEPGTNKFTLKFSGVAGKAETIYFQYGKVGPVTACSTAREALFTIHRDMIPYLETPLEKITAKKK